MMVNALPLEIKPVKNHNIMLLLQLVLAPVNMVRGWGAGIGFSIAIGAGAGQTGQGEFAIAIGNQAGTLNQHSGTIILCGTGTGGLGLNSTQTNSFYVAPVRASSSSLDPWTGVLHIISQAAKFIPIQPKHLL